MISAGNAYLIKQKENWTISHTKVELNHHAVFWRAIVTGKGRRRRVERRRNGCAYLGMPQIPWSIGGEGNTIGFGTGGI